MVISKNDIKQLSEDGRCILPQQISMLHNGMEQKWNSAQRVTLQMDQDKREVRLSRCILPRRKFRDSGPPGTDPKLMADKSAENISVA